MKEIGSEFWNVPLSDKENGVFPKKGQWYLSGRIGLKAVIQDLKAIKAKTVAVPSWCCHTMITPFLDAEMKVYFYPVYYDNGLVQEIRLDCDVLFLMDYFGYSAPTPVIRDYSGIVIRDVTHSIFSNTFSDADYYFGSLRKWCGVWTGGYAWQKDGYKLVDGEPDHGNYVNFRERAMQLKSNYINSNEGNKDYLRIYDKAEEYLETVGIVSAAERDVWMAHKLDVEFMRTRRRVNAEILRSAFFEWLIFPDMSDTDCPLFVPIFVPNGKRDELRRFLISHKIYCPVHWPVRKHHRIGEKERFVYDSEISLVCDQRYTNEDMYRIVETIREFWEGQYCSQFIH